MWADLRVLIAEALPALIDSGVRDAFNLGRKLALVAKGVCQDTLLYTCEAERKAHAEPSETSIAGLPSARPMSRPGWDVWRSRHGATS